MAGILRGEMKPDGNEDGDSPFEAKYGDGERIPAPAPTPFASLNPPHAGVMSKPITKTINLILHIKYEAKSKKVLNFSRCKNFKHTPDHQISAQACSPLILVDELHHH